MMCREECCRKHFSFLSDANWFAYYSTYDVDFHFVAVECGRYIYIYINKCTLKVYFGKETIIDIICYACDENTWGYKNTQKIKLTKNKRSA